MDVGETYIVFGANTGSLYFFNRAGLRFLQLVSSPEIRAAVTHIRFSPDERFVALSTLDGELVVLEPKLGTRAKERIVLRHHLHRDAAATTTTATTSTPATASSSTSLTPAPATPSTTASTAAAAAAGAGEGPVTCLTWAPRGQDDENYLFSSDATGSIIITPVITSLIKRSLLLASAGPEPLYKADSRVVQLDCTSVVAASASAPMKLQLLISTLTKSLLLTIDTNAKQLTGLQVGSKPRKGNYGACFCTTTSAAAAASAPTVLCAARPGRRIWLADAVTATVRKTLNFSTSLELLPAFATSPATNLVPRPKLVTFGKLMTFGEGDFLLSWDDERTKAQHALCLIDVQKVEIRAWTCFAAIRDLCVLSQEGCVYVLHDVSETKGATRTVLSKIAIPLSHNPTTAGATAAASAVTPAIVATPTDVTTPVAPAGEPAAASSAPELPLPAVADAAELPAVTTDLAAAEAKDEALPPSPSETATTPPAATEASVTPDQTTQPPAAELPITPNEQIVHHEEAVAAELAPQELANAVAADDTLTQPDPPVDKLTDQEPQQITEQPALSAEPAVGTDVTTAPEEPPTSEQASEPVEPAAGEVPQEQPQTDTMPAAGPPAALPAEEASVTLPIVAQAPRVEDQGPEPAVAPPTEDSAPAEAVAEAAPAVQPAPSPPVARATKAVSDMTESESSSAAVGAEPVASPLGDHASTDAAAATAVRRVRTSEDGLSVPRPRTKKGGKRRTARIEEAVTKSPTKSVGGTAAAAILPPLAQVRPAASTLREILSSSSSGVTLPSSSSNTPTITATSGPVPSAHSAPSSPTVPALSAISAAAATTSLPASPLVPVAGSTTGQQLSFITPESLADVVLPPLSSSPSSSAAGPLASLVEPSAAADSALPPSLPSSESFASSATGLDVTASEQASLGSSSSSTTPAVTVAATSSRPRAPSSNDAPSGAPAEHQAGGAAAAGGDHKEVAAGGGVGAANSLMSTKKWKEEIQNVGRRAMQLSKTPVNLDEIFQKQSLNFFKKSSGDKEGESHDDQSTITASSGSSAAATAEKDKQLARAKKEKEDTEKKQKGEKAKKDKADKENADHSKDVKSAAGLFKRAANTLLESTSKPGSISSSDVAGLFNKAKSLVSITKFAAGHDANGGAAHPAVAPGDEADDPQKAFWQLSKSLFEVLASSLPASTKFTSETQGNMREWIEEWSSLATSPEGLPPTWVTEILTACFEQHVIPSSLSVSSSAPHHGEFAVGSGSSDNSEDGEEEDDEEERTWKLRERDLMAFLDRYFALLDHDRVLFFCNAHRLSLCISFFLHTEQILLHQTAALTPASAATAAAQYLVQLWQALEHLLQPSFSSAPDVEKEAAAVEEALAVLRKADNNLSLVLRFLPSLFTKSPRVTAQYAASLYPFVRSWNVRDALPPTPVVVATSSSGEPFVPPFTVSANIRTAHRGRGGPGEVRPSVSKISYDERWTVYADYLQQLVERHEECRRDSRIVHELFECALQQGVEATSPLLTSQDSDDGRKRPLVWRRELFFDDEGRPRLTPRDLRWKRNAAVLQSIVRDDAQRKYAHHPRRLLYLAKRYGHFEAVKELALQVDDVFTALEVGVFTDDWVFVSRVVQRHGGDLWFWQQLLAFVAALWRREGRLAPESTTQESESGSDVNGAETKATAAKKLEKQGIQLDDLVAHMIRGVGPIPAFEMIAASAAGPAGSASDVAELATALPPTAYRHFVQAVNVDIQHKELVYWMLKRVLEDLWLDKHTKRPPTIAPQFRAVKDAEVAGQLDALPFLHRLAGPAAASILGPREQKSAQSNATAAAQTPNEKQYNIGFDYTTPTPRFFEEMTGHWGLRQQLATGSCECCTLPLAESVGRSSSLVVFECGHAFHEFCVAEDACPVCLTSHMPSLSSFLPATAPSYASIDL